LEGRKKRKGRIAAIAGRQGNRRRKQIVEETHTMKTFFTKLLQSKSGAFKDFAELEAKVAALGERTNAVKQLDEKTTMDVNTAQAGFDESPSVATLEALRDTLSARAGFAAGNFYLRVSDSIRYATQASWRSPESLSTLRGCLDLIRGGLNGELETMRSKLKSAFAEAGDVGANVDATPSVQRLIFQINEITDLLAWLNLPSGFDDQKLMRILALIRGALPEPPAPKVIPPTMEERHKAEVLARLGATPEAPAPATNGHRRLLPSYAELNPKELAARQLTGHRL
jgi:hypothetical protein